MEVYPGCVLEHGNLLGTVKRRRFTVLSTDGGCLVGGGSVLVVRGSGYHVLRGVDKVLYNYIVQVDSRKSINVNRIRLTV